MNVFTHNIFSMLYPFEVLKLIEIVLINICKKKFFLYRMFLLGEKNLQVLVIIVLVRIKQKVLIIVKKLILVDKLNLATDNYES